MFVYDIKLFAGRPRYPIGRAATNKLNIFFRVYVIGGEREFMGGGGKGGYLNQQC